MEYFMRHLIGVEDAVRAEESPERLQHRAQSLRLDRHRRIHPDQSPPRSSRPQPNRQSMTRHTTRLVSVSTPARIDATPEVIAGLDAWRDLPAAQQPVWPDAEALATAVRTLSSYPPLVFAGECDVLKTRLGDAAVGKAFVLQGGDCAETFASATADNIRDRIKTILQMAAVLTYGASMPV